MGGTVVALATIVLGAVAFGHGFLRLAGAREWTWTAPAVGLGLAIMLAAVGLRLGAEATTVAAVLAGLAVVSLVSMLRRRGRLPLAAPWEGVVVGALALAGTLIPFLVNRRFGLLGVSFNDDASRHLLAIDYLRVTGEVPDNVFGLAYPSGPHALAAVVAAGTRARADQALDAFLMSIPILTALSALASFARGSRWRSALGALVVGLAYLPIAYYTSAAFKETAMALWLLTFAVTLHRASAPTRATTFALAILAGVCIYTYSYSGLAWPIGTLGLWAAGALAFSDRGSRRRRTLGVLSRALPAVGLLLVLLLPTLDALVSLFGSVGFSPASAGIITKANLGYTVRHLSPFEGLGVWPSGDFRLAPRIGFVQWPAGLVGTAAVAYGLAWALRRREPALPAAFATAGLLYAWFRLMESPWISAKGLVILSPIAVLLGVRALVAPAAPAWRIVLAAAFVLGTLGSSLLALRTAQVEPPGHRNELAGLAQLIPDQRVLLLTTDVYGPSRLFPVAIDQLGGFVRPEKRYKPGDPYDFDSPPALKLAQFSHVITTRAGYGSTPPPGFRVVHKTRSYVLWKREREGPPRATLVEGPAPGATLDCNTAPGRDLARRQGVAVVVPPPVEADLPRTLGAGTAVNGTLTLAPGLWRLSLQYQSARRLELRGPGVKVRVPASLDPLGSFWPVGTLRVSGAQGGAPMPVNVTLAMPDEVVPLLRRRAALLGRLTATRAASTPQQVPLRHACGHYVDWFTVRP